MPGCDRQVGDFQTLTSKKCDCSGFRPIRGPLGEATFAMPNNEPPDAPLPPLRVAQ
jgi:hypothetical protein